MTSSTRTRRALAASIALGVTGAVAGAFAMASPGAGATAAPHTLTFTAVALTQHSTSPKSFVVSSADKQGKAVIGYDVISGVVRSSGDVELHAAFAVKGGVIYADLVVPVQGPSADGRITGGSGAYRGIHGTITSTSSADDSRQQVTLTYEQ